MVKWVGRGIPHSPNTDSAVLRAIIMVQSIGGYVRGISCYWYNNYYLYRCQSILYISDNIIDNLKISAVKAENLKFSAHFVCLLFYFVRSDFCVQSTEPVLFQLNQVCYADFWLE